MFNPNRRVFRPGGEPTGPEGLGKIRLPEQKEVETGLLNKILSDEIVEPENTLPSSKSEVMKFRQEIRTKVSKILERKAGILAELEKITDYETLLQRLGSYFIEMAQEINNLVSEIEKNQQIGLEAAVELIEDIQNNSLCLDPKKDGDLINKLEAELAKLSQNSSQLEEPLNLVPRYQLALISDGGKRLEEFKKRVKAALERNNYEELKGLVKEISDQLKRSADYRAILISEGGNTLEQFRRRVKAALERSETRNNLKRNNLKVWLRNLKVWFEKYQH
jgi:hypothetical protein